MLQQGSQLLAIRSSCTSPTDAVQCRPPLLQGSCALCLETQLRRRGKHVSASGTSVIREIQYDLASKKRSAREIAEHYINRLEQVEPHVESFLALSTAQALEQASVIDKALANGEKLGPLAAVPLAIKVYPPMQIYSLLWACQMKHNNCMAYYLWLRLGV